MAASTVEICPCEPCAGGRVHVGAGRKVPMTVRRQGSTSVVVATDSPLIGDGIASLLAEVDEVDVVGTTSDYLDLVRMVDEAHPQAVIVNIRSPHRAALATIAVARQLRREFPRLGILIISDHDDGDALEAIRGGASRVAYLMDERRLDMETVLDALHDVCSGHSALDSTVVDSLVSHYEGVPVGRLTSREPEVLEQMARGLSNRAIASALNISVKAIEKDITAIFRKLELVDRSHVDRRVTAALWFLRGQTDPFGSGFPRERAVGDLRVED